MPTESRPKTLSLTISVSRQEKAMLTQAAHALNTTVSRFVLQKACKEAESVLGTPTEFQLSAKKWRQFQRALDARPKKLPKLRTLLNQPGVFDG